MDHKDTNSHSVIERRKSIAEMQGDNSGTLSEAKVRLLSKNLASLRLKNDDAVEDKFLRQVQALIQALLTTLTSSKTSLGHGAATCDALCGLLELCEASGNGQIRALAFDSSMWTQAFDVYLTRSEINKSKPMRHLLSTLAKIAFHYPTASERVFLIRYAVSSAILTVIGDIKSSSIKAAVQALEHFLNKHMINASQLVFMLTEKRELGEFDMTAEDIYSDRILNASDAECVKSMEDFVFSIFQWVQYPDLAPATGRLISSLFLSLQRHLVENKSEGCNDLALPLWLPPIKKALNEEPELLEGLAKHILPGLLRLCPAGTQAFLDTLPLKDLQEGDIGSHTLSNTKLCLLTARIVVELGSNYNSRSNLCSEADLNGSDLQDLGIKLLVNASPDIRIAALDLATYSRSSIEPFSRRLLGALRQTLPLFHAEVNTRARNEFINQMKKLCTRLRSSIFSLNKTSHYSTQTPNGENDRPRQRWIQRVGEDLDSDPSLMAPQISFLDWYAEFLTRELHPTSSYQRHIAALQLLYWLLPPDDGAGAVRLPPEFASNRDKEPLQKSLFTPQLLRCALDLMLDPFDDVRNAAAAIFELAPSTLLAPASDIGGFTMAIEPRVDDRVILRSDHRGLIHTLFRAEAIMRYTGRADHADGVGRLYNLLYGTCQNSAKPDNWYQRRLSILTHILERLEHDIRVARDNVRLAVGKYTLHGYLIALRYIINRPDFYSSLIDDSDTGPALWRRLNQRIFKNCEDVWEAVKEVLCIDSPEGHASEEDELDGLDIGTKDTLSFSWRALKEASSLCHAMVTSPAYGPPNPKTGLWYDELQNLGTLAFTQLVELRHRGAFSTVSQTFAACCLLCARRNHSSITRLPKQWYLDVLESIQQNASALTRRSAGIPSLITGILAAFPVGDFLIEVILDLQAIADEPIQSISGEKMLRLPQVHALNCLKDIFTDTRLGPGTEPHVADTLDIAASCIESNIWEIRNCGLMLFKALIRRLHGGTDTSSTRVPSSHRRLSNLIYEKYPSLPDLLVKMLRQADKPTMAVDRSEIAASMQAQRVFPALEIIERSGLPSQQRLEIKKLIWDQMESSAWPIREKAAKALGLVLSDEDYLADIKTILRPDWPSQNALHGRLLYLHQIILLNTSRLSARSHDHFEALLPLLDESFETVVVLNNCSFTITAYLNVLVDVLQIMIGSSSIFYRTFALKCRESLSKGWPTVSTPGSQEELFRKPSSSLLASAFKRCLGLTDNACCSARQATQVSTSLDPEEIAPEENDATSSQDLQCGARPEKLQRKGPLDFDEVLRLDGGRIVQKYITNSNDSDTQRKLSVWVRALALAGGDRSELSSRMAAVASIKTFITVLQAHDSIPNTIPELLGVYLALYDALVDDDEYVRDQASVVVSSLLSVSCRYGDSKATTSLSLSSLAASPRLLLFLVREYNESVCLWSEAIRRLTGASPSVKILPIKEPPTLQLRPVKVLLQEAMRTDNALFVEEKQNLFVDDVKEAEMWAGALADLNARPDAISKSALGTWTLDGISALTVTIRNNVDGPLGWTSKPEAFTIGIRVILAAKLLLDGHEIDGSPARKERQEKCRDSLSTFLDVGRENMVHDLWLQRIEEVIGLVR